MTITDKEYAEHVEQLLAALGQQHAAGRDIEIAFCVNGLEKGRDHKKVRDYVVKTLKRNGAEFDRAMRAERARNDFHGEYPDTAKRFVEMMAERMNITGQYNGVLRKSEMPYIEMEDGSKAYIDPKRWGDYEFRLMVATKFHRVVSFDEFNRDVRIAAVEYELPFHAAALNDLCESWFHRIINDRLWLIAGSIDYPNDTAIRAKGQASLQILAETYFECPNGAEFVVAVFNKFIWQVKRKINQLPIYDHLMPVILGGQGIGKSTLIRKMLASVQELWMMTDFKQITDDRNISLWRNFVIFLDEMGWASKSDMDTVKNIITAPTLTRRVMRTNITQEVPQNATFIGAANADELADLIRDVSGTRRFVSLDMLATPNREVINRIDWRAVWQSVDERAEDPMASFKGLLQAAQAEDRTPTAVEAWLASLTAMSFIGAVQIAGREFTSKELFLDFNEYEKTYFPNSRNPTSIIVFGRQMKHLCKSKSCQFERTEDHKKAVFKWCGDQSTKQPAKLHVV